MYANLSMVLILAIIILPWVVIIVKSSIQRSRFILLMAEMDALRRRIDVLEGFLQETDSVIAPEPYAYAPDESIDTNDVFSPPKAL